MRIGSQPVVGGLAGKAVARQRRNHDVERVRRAAAVRRRIGQRIDDLQLLDDRAGPAVRDDDRQRVRLLRAHVDEVDVDAVDLGHELRQGVQPRLDLAPVVVRRPVARELLHRRELHALRLVRRRSPCPASAWRRRGVSGRRAPRPRTRRGRGEWRPCRPPRPASDSWSCRPASCPRCSSCAPSSVVRRPTRGCRRPATGGRRCARPGGRSDARETTCREGDLATVSSKSQLRS